MNAVVEKAWKYGLNVPVLTAALLALSLLVFGESSREDVCSAYADVYDDITSAYSPSTDSSRDSHIEDLVRAAKNYSSDSDIQNDGNDLEEAHDDTYTLDGIYSAMPNIVSMCG